MDQRFVPPARLAAARVTLNLSPNPADPGERAFAPPTLGWRISGEADADVGRVALTATPDPHAAAVSVELAAPHRGRGYASEAVRSVATWYFASGGTRLLWSRPRTDFDSWRVAWACGFRRVGTLGATELEPHGSWLACLNASDSLEAATPWVEPPELPIDAADALLRPWSVHDVDRVRGADVAPETPADIFAATRFPDWLLGRREQMATGLAASWCLARASDDLPVGEVILFVEQGRLDDDTAELGYYVAPAARGSGLARAAAEAAIGYARTSAADGGIGLRRLTAQTSAANRASNATLLSLGFTRWGREPDADALPSGPSVDELHWSLLL